MAKVPYAQNKSIEQTSVYRSAVETILKNEQETLVAIRSNAPDATFKRLGLVDSMLNLASNYIIIDGVVQSVLKLKNEDSLNEARKALYKSIIYLEEIVSNYIDAPYSDYEAQLVQIDYVSPAERYLLIRKMGLTIQLLKNAYGDNTKWKWTFVEIEGRYATVAKNIMNLKDVMINSDFASEHYEPTIRHLALIKKLLSQAADRYREKYELSTSRIDDFKLGIMYLAALRRISILTGDQEEAVTTKKKLDIWKVKLATDTEKQEKMKNEL
ncbi:MAG: hypothetical protein LBB89_11270 [Treponema sp.]|jgi:hypothetical protein|nr:hypothetical protein [Treponema sp.]